MSCPNTAFSIKEPKQTSLWESIRGVKPKENAIIAINNLLASQGLSSFSAQNVKQIAFDYKVDFRKEFLPDLWGFYKYFLLYCLNDKFLSNQEIQELSCLKEALSLTDVEVNTIHNEVTGELYKMEVEKVIQDGRLSEEEKNFLKQIQQNLKINDSYADRIFKESANELMKKVLDEALSDNLLTEEEEHELEEIKKSLNIEVVLEGSIRANFEKCRLFWQIEKGNLPKIETDLFLEDECCHFFTKAEWLEQKKSSKLNGNSGLINKIALGAHWKVNQSDLKPELEDIWATMDSGKVYITDKQLIMSGNEGEKSLSLKDIVDFWAYGNGINIVAKEKTIFLQFRYHIDIFAMILGKLIYRNTMKA
jgi:hypothetical protein